MKNKILIFTATYNERENIRDLLNSIDKLKLELDILIIDDNSPDQTSEIIKQYNLEKNNIKLIVRNKKEGLDTAHKLAFKYSIENNYEHLITLDADLSHDPKEIPTFIKELNDLVNELITLGFIENKINIIEKKAYFWVDGHNSYVLCS